MAVCRVSGTDLGEWMVAQGWALAYWRYSTDYVATEEAARRARAGLWAGTFVPPWEHRAGAARADGG
jgi:endonuclease YncB( thermonuclease family)